MAHFLDCFDCTHDLIWLITCHTFATRLLDRGVDIMMGAVEMPKSVLVDVAEGMTAS